MSLTRTLETSRPYEILIQKYLKFGKFDHFYGNTHLNFIHFYKIYEIQHSVNLLIGRLE